ncbi:restriction endonuclease subunit S [Halobacillus sp. Marseille-Q1614]|uniref:restriction endonuclease subunit S n=1 Tax=Halobacillus sp. Marseille-Q1614 TaxID=2709134 RepID=UPI001570C183|nr:restriction endonuclease subunit S [Halobacillus sp. Marseille-Q1614]
MENKKTPEIRFNEFNDKWDLYRLGDISESMEYGLNASSKVFDGENKYLRITDIDENSNKFSPIKLTSPSVDVKNLEHYQLRFGDIVFARTGASTGKTYCYEEEDGKVFYAGFLIRARIKSEFDPRFIFQNTLTKRYHNFVKISSQRSGQPGINAKDYSNFSIMVPPYKEQQKIGQYFKQLDDRIAFQQRQIELLKESKQGFLQKMFPKDGERVPEVRFDGFSGEWKLRKLSDVAKYRNGKAHEKNIDENGQYVVVNSKFVSSNGNVKKYTKNLIEPLTSGEIAFVLSDVPNGKALARTYIIDSCDKFSLNQRIAGIKPKEDTDSYFLSILLNRNVYFLKFDSGVGQTNLSRQEVESFSNYYPTYHEQQKIGEFFKNLDDTIVIHEKELKLLRETKKGFLQKMFV